MKTPLQQLIDRLESERDRLSNLMNYSDPINDSKRFEIRILNNNIFEAKQLLEVEKEVIIEAHGTKRESRFLDSPLIKTGEQYYNETFKND